MKKVIAVGIVVFLLLSLCSCGPQKAESVGDASVIADEIVDNYDSKWSSKANVNSNGLMRESIGVGEFAIWYEIEITLKKDLKYGKIENMVDNLHNKIKDAFYGYDVATIIFVYNDSGILRHSYIDGELYEK